MRLVTLTCSSQQIQVAQKFLVYHEDQRDWEPEVVWIYGPPGVGKTVLAFKMCGSDDRYVKKNQSKWFQGYDAHENVIFDDIREAKHGITFMMLLGLLDSKPFSVECKGGSRQFLAKRIFLTSINKPEHCFGTVGYEAIGQLTRRIDKVINLGDPLVRREHSVPDVPEVGRVIIRPTNSPPPLIRQPDLWGNAEAFSFYTPQKDLETKVVWDDGVDTIEMS